MRVSVIIPVYNAVDYLGEAVASVLEQPEVQEVLLIDDGSEDGSLFLAHELAKGDNRVKVLSHPNAANLGSAETRNAGIKAATQDYIAFIDADDWFMPNRFGQTKKVFAQYPHAEGVYEAVKNIKTDKAKSFTNKVNIDGTPDIHMVHRRVDADGLLALLIDDPTGIILLQGLCVKRSLFDKVGLFDGAFRVFEDMLLVKKMAAVGSLWPGSLTQPVSARRIHDSNISFSSIKDTDDKKHLESEALLKWALKHQVTAQNMNAIVRFYYRFCMYRTKQGFNNKWERAKWLATTFVSYPKLILYRQYWAAMPILGKLIRQ